MTPDQLFLSQLPYIKKVVAQTCRRYHFRKEEAEDFASEVNCKLIEDDYAVLRQFQGKSSLERYLTVVIKRFHLDYLNRLWGKWRPCAEAVRLGPVAVLLDMLLTREKLTFDEAVEILQTNHKVEMSWQELHDIAVRFPPRTSRPGEEGDETLEFVPDPTERADEHIVARERAVVRERVLQELKKALATLPPEDRLILRMRMWSRFSIPLIAEKLQLDEKEQKQLYRRIDRIEEHLKGEMERQGISQEDIQDFFNE